MVRNADLSRAALTLIVGLGINLLPPSATAAGDTHAPVATFRLVSCEGKPLLTDAEIVVYFWPTHTMVVKPGVQERLASAIADKLIVGYPFMVEANGVFAIKAPSRRHFRLTSSRALPSYFPATTGGQIAQKGVAYRAGLPVRKVLQGWGPTRRRKGS